MSLQWDLNEYFPLKEAKKSSATRHSIAANLKVSEFKQYIFVARNPHSELKLLSAASVCRTHHSDLDKYFPKAAVRGQELLKRDGAKRKRKRLVRACNLMIMI